MIDFIAMIAMAAAQAPAETPFTVFDEDAGGWTVVRRADGCFMFAEPGRTGINIFYNVGDDAPFLSVIFSDATWHFREEDLQGYRIELNGSGGDWQGLNGSTFQDAEEDFGVVTLNFSEDAIALMLTDVMSASDMVFSRNGQLIANVDIPDGARGVGRLLDCVRTVSTRPLPQIPASGSGVASPPRVE